MIYFITEDNNTEYVKIGYTNNLSRRLRELQIGNPKKLSVYFVMKGDKQFELELHKTFKDYRGIGEWFNFTVFIGNYIDEVRKEAEQLLDVYNTQLTENARLVINKLELYKVFTKLDKTNKFVINTDTDLVEYTVISEE